MSNESDERNRFVKAALSFVGTPYHHRAMLKGIGIDCATLLICAAAEAGLIERFEPPIYSQQFNLHRSDEVYIETISKLCDEVRRPYWLPGDIPLWKFGRCFSHAAIVIKWPMVVHACIGHQVRTEEVTTAEWLMYMGERREARPLKLFTLKRWNR